MHQFNPHLTHKSIGPVQIKAPDGVHWSVPNSFNSMFFQTRTSCRIFGIGLRVKTALLILHTRWRKYILKFLRTNHEKGRSDILREKNSAETVVFWRLSEKLKASFSQADEKWRWKVESKSESSPCVTQKWKVKAKVQAASSPRNWKAEVKSCKLTMQLKSWKAEVKSCKLTLCHAIQSSRREMQPTRCSRRHKFTAKDAKRLLKRPFRTNNCFPAF